MKILALQMVGLALILAGCDTTDELGLRREGMEKCRSEGQLYVNMSTYQENSNPGPFRSRVHEEVTGYCITPVDRELLENEVAQLKGATSTEAENRIVVTSADNSIQYYFTEPGHRAYPWAVKVFTTPTIPRAAQTSRVDGMRWIAAKPRNSPLPSTDKEAGIISHWMLSAVGAANPMW